jgi:hypothetical protein
MHTDIYALSGIRNHDPSVRAVKTVHALDRAATVIGSSNLKLIKNCCVIQQTFLVFIIRSLHSIHKKNVCGVVMSVCTPVRLNFDEMY